MSGLGDIGSALGGMFGLTSSYDKEGAQRATDAYGTSLSDNTGAYQNTLNDLNNRADRYSATNYMQGAQQAYGQQQNAASMLYNQATGAAASPADLQMQMGLANANNQAQSAAYSQQGGVSPGLTQRNMLGAQAAQNAQIVGQGGIMRAQEQAMAQNQYANILSAMQNEQQNMGNFAYQQGQNNLGFQQGNAGNLLNAQTSAAANNYNAQMSNFRGQSDATAAQGAAIKGTAQSFMTGGML